jgi:hypothetical protein
MPQITLQRAAHVFNRIKAETAFSTETEDAYTGYGRRRNRPRNTFTLSVDVSVDQQVRQQADAYRNLALGKLEKLFALMEIGTRIRAATTQRQATAGITALVTRRVMVVQQIAVLEHLLESVEAGVYAPESIEQQATLIKQRLNASTQGNTTATVSTVVLTADDREKLTRRLAATRSALMGIDDELATLNAMHYIEVSSDDMKVLQEAGLAA